MASRTGILKDTGHKSRESGQNRKPSIGGSVDLRNQINETIPKGSITHLNGQTGNNELPGFSDFVDKVNKKSVLQHKSKGNKEKSSKSGKEGKEEKRRSSISPSNPSF